jgi:FlaA1/EpsC-like NDP-sugar epimerase
MPMTEHSSPTFDKAKARNMKLLGKQSQISIDIIIFVFAFIASFFIRFEGVPDPINLRQMLLFFPLVGLVRLLTFQIFSVYSIAWRYVSAVDAVSIVKSCIPVTTILLIGRIFLPGKLALFKIPYSVIALEFLLSLLGTLSVRMIRRLIFEQSERSQFENKGELAKKKRILLIGAGNAGNMVMKELRQRADLGFDVIGFIDDDPRKINTNIHGRKILGTTEQIPEIVQKYRIDEALISIANASSKVIRHIVNICEKAKIKVKIVPGLFELLDDKFKITKIRDINIEDLLGRSVISFEEHRADITAHYQNKRILVTGAGGSIGSELCRQLSAYGPQELILLDKDENSIYEIDAELRNQSPHIPLAAIICDVRNEQRLAQIFSKYTPQVVFHAAAHKHVPLMEMNVSEAILNNVGGTQNVAQLANRGSVESFIFISTDKAVNPTSVMGATKKAGEIIVQDIAARSRTRFACVRFGNVLGSRGSVVPLFQKQIAKGGPITITHPLVTRYFMSISEAVQLIIQAGTLGSKGEIFVLDMGEPIKIQDLAADLIKLSGYTEDDFNIKYIGLRPGEKLFEEILIDDERTQATQFRKIFIAPPLEIDQQEFKKHLEILLLSAQRCDEQRILEILKALGIGFRTESHEDVLPLGRPS